MVGCKKITRKYRDPRKQQQHHKKSETGTSRQKQKDTKRAKY